MKNIITKCAFVVVLGLSALGTIAAAADSGQTGAKCCADCAPCCADGKCAKCCAE